MLLKKGGIIIQQLGTEKGGLSFALGTSVVWSADLLVELNGRVGQRGVKLNFSEDPGVHGVVGSQTVKDRSVVSRSNQLKSAENE